MASNHTRDSTGTRYHGKAPYNWPELRRLQEEEGERKRKARPKPPSGPDRCFVVNVDGVEKPPKPLQQMSFAFKEWDEARTSLSVEWEASAKTTPSTGFMDLSRELRDMVYQAICSELKREGVEWSKTAPEVDEETEEKERASEGKPSGPADSAKTFLWKTDDQRDPVERPGIFADCTIMRTCRQMHAEFASVLYGSPMHLSPAIHKGKNTISISPIYASLVRAVYCEMKYSDRGDSPEAWWWQLSVATGLSKMFANTHVLRLGWCAETRIEGVRTLAAISPEAWNEAVRQAKGAIKAVRSVSNTPLLVPYNFELVHLHRKGLGAYRAMYTPVTEAAAQMRAKIKPRKGKHAQTI